MSALRVHVDPKLRTRLRHALLEFIESILGALRSLVGTVGDGRSDAERNADGQRERGAGLHLPAFLHGGLLDGTITLRVLSRWFRHASEARDQVIDATEAFGWLRLDEIDAVGNGGRFAKRDGAPRTEIVEITAGRVVMRERVLARRRRIASAARAQCHNHTRQEFSHPAIVAHLAPAVSA